jgi:hypothetical protein
MGGINVTRWFAGGIAAGVVVWALEWLASIFYMDDAQAALEAANLTMDMTSGTWILTVVLSLIIGLALVFFYAAARPRFGPGPKTAATVAVVLWFASYLVSLLGYHMIGLYPTSMLALWGLVGLIELIVAAMVGGWVYREAEVSAEE